jgi:hypothetical protein
MKTAGISSDAVKAKTGKGWEAWFAILDGEKAASLPHKEIAALLNGKHGVAAWWAQMVAVGYEQARGLRQVNEQTSGFTANLSRTLSCSALAVFEAFTDTNRRKRWLDLELKITTSTAPKSVRIAVSDGTRVDVNLYPKGDAKTTIQLQHEKLPSAEAVLERKTYWDGAIEKLRTQLTSLR